jgi:hypothetical protein
MRVHRDSFRAAWPEPGKGRSGPSCATRLIAAGIAWIVCAAAVRGAEPGVLPPIDERFGLESGDQPDFQRHVVPLLGRLGCNSRACHGSFQGQGGFQLSLFGYDFEADHANLLGGEEPRTSVDDPAASLILRKPLEEVSHEGGRRFARDSWQHRVLLAWIAGGAMPVAAGAPPFDRLEVEPAEFVGVRPGDRRQLRVVAVWGDGAREDVTPLCRFQTNDDQVATIDEAGLVTVIGRGDTHVVVFYDDGVVPVPVMLPVSDLVGSRFPAIPTPTRIDELVAAKLRPLGIVPSQPCDDAEFLRRVAFDIAGTLPTPDEIEAFLADEGADKRERKVDELLDSPAYAAWWATRFCDWTGNNEQKNQNSGPDNRAFATAAWYEWLRVRLERNVPYDELVEGIVMARSRLDGESYDDYCTRMSGYQRGDPAGSFAEQPYLPYFWSRSNFQTAEQRALGFAYTFLGVRIQCAQCHKHPFDEWTKDDFARFQNFFARVRHGEAPGTKDAAAGLLEELGLNPKARGGNVAKDLAKLVREGHVVPYRETYVVEPPKPKGEKPSDDRAKDRERKKNDRRVVGRTATVLGGDEFAIDDLADPRRVLMDWMRDDDNPYFAKAIVNRVWAAYFNVGIVEPPDDLSLANPPSNAPLLDHLANEFRRRGYDLKWLHREIATSRTYQSGWRPNDTNRLDERNFSRAVPRRIPAEAVLDAIRVATAGEGELAALAASSGRGAAGEPVAAGWGKTGQYALTVFGRSSRESNCDCDRSMEPSLLQTVFLRNDRDMLAQIDRKGGWVDELARLHGTTGKKEAAAADLEASEVAAIVRQAYLRTLSRPPHEPEAERAAAHFGEAGTVREAARDLMWALLNTKEFLVNH